MGRAACGIRVRLVPFRDNAWFPQGGVNGLFSVAVYEAGIFFCENLAAAAVGVMLAGAAWRLSCG